MWQLSMYPFETFNLAKGFTLIAIANPKIYWTMNLGLREDNGAVQLFNAGGEQALEKNVIFWGEPSVNLDITKLFEKKLIKRVIDTFDEDDLGFFFEQDRLIKQRLMQHILKTDLPIEVTTDWDLTNLLKSQNFKLAATSMTSSFDTIISVIDMMSELEDNRILVLNHCHLFFSEKELNELAEYTTMKNVSVLSIDIAPNKVNLSEQWGRSYQIDDDFIQF